MRGCGWRRRLAPGTSELTEYAADLYGRIWRSQKSHERRGNTLRDDSSVKSRVGGNISNSRDNFLDDAIIGGTEEGRKGCHAAVLDDFDLIVFNHGQVANDSADVFNHCRIWRGEQLEADGETSFLHNLILVVRVGAQIA